MRGVWLDTRIGGVPTWRYCDEQELMRVPDALRDCTCFVQTQRANTPTGLGTAFFVGVKLAVEDRVTCYAVTAKHCLYDALDADGVPDEVALWLNLRDGGIDRVVTRFDDWVQHPTADVAVLRILPDVGRFRFKLYPVASAADAAFREQRQVSAGEDVFLTGLLAHHPGRSQIIPVVRVGNIAALPVDPVSLRHGHHASAQIADDIVALIEVRSIGGLSGSPVFLHLPAWRDLNAGDTLIGGGGGPGSGGANYLLGVIHGMLPVGKKDPDRVSGGDENMNTGIAAVVLVDRILDLINGPSEVAWRDSLARTIEEAQMPIPTGADLDERFKLDAEPEDALRSLLGATKRGEQTPEADTPDDDPSSA